MTIQIILKAYGSEGIFDHYLFKKYNDIEGTDKERAEEITEILKEQHKAGNDNEINALYDYCWDRFVPVMEDNLNYTEGETVRSLFRKECSKSDSAR